MKTGEWVRSSYSISNGDCVEVMAVPPAPPAEDFYDQHPDLFAALIRSSRWWCLDCADDDVRWESVTDYCQPANDHHYATGHRVDGIVECRYRARPIAEIGRTT